MNREEEYLSGKPVLLDMPGTKISDIYYNKYNTQVELVESTSYNGKLNMDLTSSYFSAVGSINIPNGSFLGETYLYLKIDENLFLPGMTLCRGWGYAAISRIEYLFGSSNTAQTSIFMHNIWQHLCSQSETSEKASELFALGGEAMVGPYAPYAGQGGVAPPIEAHILLPLPWCSASSSPCKKEFDMSLLNNPITVNVYFNTGTKFIGGIVNSNLNKFQSAKLSFRTSELTDMNNSFKNRLMSDPMAYSAYPFIHVQNYQVTQIQGIADYGMGRCSVELQQFINADLMGISFGLVRASRDNALPLTQSLPTQYSTPCPFAYDLLSNITLTLNGQLIYNTNGEGHRLISLRNKMGAASWENSITQAVAPAVLPGTYTWNQFPEETYPVFVDFSRLRSASFLDQFQNTRRIGSQTVTLQFNTQTTEFYTVYCTYYYNAINSVSAGQSNIYY